MKIVDSSGKPFPFWKKSPRCNICKRSLEWKQENGKWKPYLLTGDLDTCYQLKPKGGEIKYG
jgi:hypothetical protein